MTRGTGRARCAAGHHHEVGRPCASGGSAYAPPWASPAPCPSDVAPNRLPNAPCCSHGVTAPGPYAGLRSALLGDDGSIRATILARSTQTNEVGRLATLLPAFAQAVPSGPVALIEVGASAGLNLFPDRWGYDWATPAGQVTLGAEPRLPCRLTGPGRALGAGKTAVM